MTRGISERSLHRIRDSKFMIESAVRNEPLKNHCSTPGRRNILHRFLQRPDRHYENYTGISLLGSKAVGR